MVEHTHIQSYPDNTAMHNWLRMSLKDFRNNLPKSFKTRMFTLPTIFLDYQYLETEIEALCISVR